MEQITINYKSVKDYCECCNQKLEEVQKTQKEFTFTKKAMLEYGGWTDVLEFEEDFEEAVENYIYETISFFAESTGTSLEITNEEKKKVEKFIKDTVSSK